MGGCCLRCRAVTTTACLPVATNTDLALCLACLVAGDATCRSRAVRVLLKAGPEALCLLRAYACRWAWEVGREIHHLPAACHHCPRR